MATVTLRARSFAQFTLSGQSKILRCAQNDSERAQDDSIAAFSAASKAPPFQAAGEKSGARRHLSSI
jgi:hypothetical protein